MIQLQTYQYQSNDLTPYPLEAGSFGEALPKLVRGTYTVLRIYPEMRVLRLALQMDRLRQSMDLNGAAFHLHENDLRHAIQLAVETADIPQPRICVLVPFVSSETIFLMVEDFSPPTESQYQHGIRAATIQFQRNQPGVKDTAFIPYRQEIRAKNLKYHEVLLHNKEGNILEGLTSNFFAILNGQLQTAGKDVLEGISRYLLLKAAHKIIPVHFHPASLAERPGMTEAFLTSTSRGILPVTEIDGVQIADGKPGPITITLSGLFDAQVETELEKL